MKKALIPAILMLTMLAACGDKEEEIEISPARPREARIEEEEPTPTTEPEDPENPIDPADPEAETDVEYLPLTVNSKYEPIYDKDIAYKVRFETSYKELVLNCDDYYALKYSLDELNKNVKDSVKQASEDYMEYAYEDGGFDDNWSYYYFRDCDTTIERADTKVVSVSMLWGDFAGGVHPNSYYEAHVYDTQSGKSLALDDIIDTSKKEEMLKLVGERALENNEGLEDMLFGDIDTALQDIDENFSFTFSLGREGLTFYFSPYEIAAYAAGSTVVTIGYDEIPGLIKDEYKQLPKDYIVEFKDASETRTLSDGREVKCSAEFDDQDGMTFCINLDGKEYSFEDYGYESWFYLAEKEGYKFVLRETQHDNDYMNVTVYDISGTAPVENDEIWASFDDGLFNPDCMQMRSRGELLSTYGMVNTYELVADNGTIIPLNEEYMITTYQDEWTITLKQDLEVEARDSFDSNDIYTMPLKAGEEITFYATDDNTYVDFKTKGGSFVRIYVDYTEYPQSVNGIDIDELFDGIMFAG